MTDIEKHKALEPFLSRLSPEGIVEVYWNTELLEITSEHLIAVQELLKKHGNGKKMPLYVYSPDFNALSFDAKQFVAKPEASEYTLANAIKIGTLAKKILFNFVLRFFTPSVPTRAFTTKEQAFEWLLKMKQELQS